MPSCGSLTVGTRLLTTTDLGSAPSDPAARLSAMSKRGLVKDLNSDQSCNFFYFAALTLNYSMTFTKEGHCVSYIFWKALKELHERIKEQLPLDLNALTFVV